MYHRIINEQSNYFFDHGLYTTSYSFENHIQDLKNNFHFVSLQELFENTHHQSNLCAITFDDGWLDTYQLAFPILKKYNVPATVFIPVNYIGTDHKFWFQNFWDIANSAAKDGHLSEFTNYLSSFLTSCNPSLGYEKNLERLLPLLKSIPADYLENFFIDAQNKFSTSTTKERTIMNWKEVAEMEQNGISFGSHGLNHYILPGLSTEQKRKEIYESFDRLIKVIRNFSPYFCYPNGDWDNESLELVKSAGYAGAVTTRLGTITLSRNPFLINRIGLHDDISSTTALLWFRLFQAFAADKNGIR
jgi:peptidoglycan/xylan/chitin deacetylase (PgdA/CDA1 family)